MELISTHICKASETGLHQNMFGGHMLSLIDESAVVYSMQLCDTPRMVTVMIDQLVFKKPVKIGNLIKIYGKVEEFGKTSIKLYIEVRKHNVYTGEQDIVTQTKIVFVRIDEDGKPRPIHQHVKERYWDRREKFGKGLLTPEEKFRIGSEI
jgi:acyl-CoA thioesterase YciA